MKPLLTGALVLAFSLSGAVSPAHASNSDLPVKRTIKDSRTSPKSVDISKVRIEASDFFASDHITRVTLPGGFRTGQKLTIWYDVDSDSKPEGRLDVTVKSVGPQYLNLKQVLRRTSSWTKKGTVVNPESCVEDSVPVSGEQPKGIKTLTAVIDAWGCFGVTKPSITKDPGRWRVSVRMTKGTKSDMAPSKRKWSKPVRGWRDEA